MEKLAIIFLAGLAVYYVIHSIYQAASVLGHRLDELHGKVDTLHEKIEAIEEKLEEIEDKLDGKRYVNPIDL